MAVGMLNSFKNKAAEQDKSTTAKALEFVQRHDNSAANERRI
jgi:hypothetical protein